MVSAVDPHGRIHGFLDWEVGIQGQLNWLSPHHEDALSIWFHIYFASPLDADK
jgi:hypothetical protein